MQPIASMTALVALGASVTAFLPASWRPEHELARRELVERGVRAEPAALRAAAASGDRELARLLVRGEVDVNEPDEEGRSALMLALENGLPDVAEALIAAGADLGAVDHGGRAVLEYAMRAGEISIVTALLDRGVDPNTGAATGGSLVAEAVKDGKFASAKLLLETGASKWAQCSEGAPMLIHATRHGAGWLVEWLLERGVSAEVRDAAGNSPMHAVVRSERTKLLPLFWAHGLDPDGRNDAGETALHVALLADRPNLLPVLIKHGASPGSRHPTGWRPLHLALQRGDFEAARILLASGANPNANGAQGRTAMDLVVALQSPPELLKLLLEAGADPEARGPDGRTAFEVILARGDLASAQVLLDHGVDSGAALYNTAVEGDEATLAFLLENKADPNRHGSDPPLVAAVRNGSAAMLEVLLRAGAATGTAGAEGQTALHLAVAMDRADLAKPLLEAGADANEPFADPASEDFLEKVRRVGFIHWQFKRDSRIAPIMMAADSGNHELARLLLAHGARTNVWTKRKGYYPVGFAARREDVKMMQILLGKDPDAEERWIKVDLSEQKAWVYDGDGQTLLTTTISSGKAGYRTKTGEFVITNKTRHHTSTIYEGARMPYFQRLSCGDFGFHEGYCPGYAASHGCIRVPRGKASQLWKLTEPGDRVVIVP